MTTAIIILFAFILGSQVGAARQRKLDAEWIARTTGGIGWLYRSPLYREIDLDQELVNAYMPPAVRMWAPEKRMPCWVEMNYKYERWRIPKWRTQCN